MRAPAASVLEASCSRGLVLWPGRAKRRGTAKSSLKRCNRVYGIIEELNAMCETDALMMPPSCFHPVAG